MSHPASTTPSIWPLFSKVLVYERTIKEYALYLNGQLVGFAPTYRAGDARLRELVHDLLSEKGDPAVRANILAQMQADALTIQLAHAAAAEQRTVPGRGKNRRPRTLPSTTPPGHLWSRVPDGPQLTVLRAQAVAAGPCVDVPDAWSTALTPLGLALGILIPSTTFAGLDTWGWTISSALSAFLDALTWRLLGALRETRTADGALVQHLTARDAESVWTQTVLATFKGAPIPDRRHCPQWDDAPVHLAYALARLIGPAWRVIAAGPVVARTIILPMVATAEQADAA